MDTLGSFLSGIVGEAIPLLAWVGLAYLFRLKAKSRRDRIVMYASAGAYMLYLGAILYYLGNQTGGCTGCGVALIVVLGLGVGIVIAGVRMFLTRMDEP